MKIHIGSVINTWADWLARWDRQDMSLFERLGLIYYGYDVKIDPKNDGDRARRFVLYLELADYTAADSKDSKEIARKAKSVLVNRVMAGKEPDINLAFGGPYEEMILPPLKAFLSNVDGKGYASWSFRTSGEYEEVETSKWFMKLLKFVMGLRDPSDPHLESLRESLLLRAFLEAPSELWITIRRADEGTFTLADLKKIVAKVQGVSPESLIRHKPSDIVSWAARNQGRGALGPGLEDMLKGRSIVSTLHHDEALLLIANLVKEQEEEARKFQGVG